MTGIAQFAGRDCSLIGESARHAITAGLAAAEWYHTDVPRKDMTALTALWILLQLATATGGIWCGIWFWGTWACVPFWIAYGVLYGWASEIAWMRSVNLALKSLAHDPCGGPAAWRAWPRMCWTTGA